MSVQVRYCCQRNWGNKAWFSKTEFTYYYRIQLYIFFYCMLNEIDFCDLEKKRNSHDKVRFHRDKNSVKAVVSDALFHWKEE